VSRSTTLSRTIALAVALSGAGIAAPAYADTVYQSATYSGEDSGEYILSNRLVGGAFTLTGTTNITGIGAQFGGYPGGSIFGAIIALDPATGLPTAAPGDLASVALAHTTFAVTPGTQDLLTPLAVTLAAGTYGVVFGTDQFGASGWAGLGWENDPAAGASTLFTSFFGGAWQSFGEPGIRLVVEGETAAVPEPAAWALMLVGFGVAGVAMRRRRTLSVSHAV
jgi:hypothetical protein